MISKPHPRAALLCLTDNRFWQGGYGSSQRIFEMLSWLSRDWHIAVFFPALLSENDGWQAVHVCPWLRLYHLGGMFAEGELVRHPQRLADAMRAHRPRVLMAEYYWMTPFIQECPTELVKDTLLVLDTHDVMHRRSAAFKKHGVDYWIQLSREEEVYWLEHFDLLVAIQDEEAAVLQQMTDRPVFTSMHGRAIEPLPLPPSDGVHRLGVFSSAGASQVYSLQQFLTHTWPALYAACPSVELHVFGHVADELGGMAVPAGVRLRGYVTNLRQAYASLHAVINPAVLASGLQIKSVEALCVGRALLSTPLGLAGMPPDVAQCEAVISCADQESWIRAVDEVVRDDVRLRQRSDVAIAVARRFFASEAVYETLSRELYARSASVQSRRRPELQTCLRAAIQAFAKVPRIARAASSSADAVIVAGTGAQAHLLHAVWPEAAKVCAYIDLDPARVGGMFLGRPVFSPHVLQSDFTGTIIVADAALRACLPASTEAKIRGVEEYLQDFMLVGSGPLLEFAQSCLTGCGDVPVLRLNEIVASELMAQVFACDARRIVIADRDHVRIASMLRDRGVSVDRLAVFSASASDSVVIFGTGRAADQAWACVEDKSAVIAFADNDVRKQGSRFHGRPVIAPAQLRELPFRRICIASMYHQQIAKQLIALGVEEDCIDVFEVKRQRFAGQPSSVFEEIRQAAAFLAPVAPPDIATLVFSAMFAEAAHIAWFDARAVALALILRHAGCPCTMPEAVRSTLRTIAALEAGPLPNCSLLLLRDGQPIPQGGMGCCRMGRVNDAGSICWTLAADSERRASWCERQVS